MYTTSSGSETGDGVRGIVCTSALRRNCTSQKGQLSFESNLISRRTDFYKASRRAKGEIVETGFSSGTTVSRRISSSSLRFFANQSEFAKEGGEMQPRRQTVLQTFEAEHIPNKAFKKQACGKHFFAGDTGSPESWQFAHKLVAVPQSPPC